MVGGGWVVAQQNIVTPSPFNFGLWTLDLDLDLDCDKNLNVFPEFFSHCDCSLAQGGERGCETICPPLINPSYS